MSTPAQVDCIHLTLDGKEYQCEPTAGGSPIIISALFRAFPSFEIAEDQKVMKY
jgi:hypothetical protein